MSMHPLSTLRSRGPFWAADVVAILGFVFLGHQHVVTPGTCVASILFALGLRVARDRDWPSDDGPAGGGEPRRQPRRRPPAGLATLAAVLWRRTALHSAAVLVVLPAVAALSCSGGEGPLELPDRPDAVEPFPFDSCGCAALGEGTTCGEAGAGQCAARRCVVYCRAPPSGPCDPVVVVDCADTCPPSTVAC